MVAPNVACGARYTFTARQGHAKHDPERGIDEQTLEIRAVHCRQAIAQQSAEREVTSSSIGDAPMLPDLLDQIPPDQEIASVTGDGAYDTRKCHDAIAARNAHAVIPPRKNAKLWKPDTPGARARNEAVRSSKYLGRALWRQLTGYHRRSRVETTLSGHCCAIPCRAADELCETARPAPLRA